MPRPTCQSQVPLKRRPDTGVTHAWQLLGCCHHLTPAQSTGHHIRSMCDPCSRRTVRLLLALSVRKRNMFSPLPAMAAEHSPHRSASCLASTPSSPLLCHRCAAAPQDPLAIAPWALHHRRADAPNPGASQQLAHLHELRVARLPLSRPTPRGSVDFG
jgi:hypothetical protein